MVSLNINLIELRSKLKRILINRMTNINVYEHPLDFSWALYALIFESYERNITLKNSLAILENWAASKDAGKIDKHLGAIGLCRYLSHDEDLKNHLIQKGFNIIRNALKKT